MIQKGEKRKKHYFRSTIIVFLLFSILSLTLINTNILQAAPAIGTPATTDTSGATSPKEEEKRATAEEKSALEDKIGSCSKIIQGDLVACVRHLVYISFVTIPSLLTSLSANLFNLMSQITLTSGIYEASFIHTMWRIVRDLVNILFIFALLAAAFQIALNIGHAAKTVVVHVIIIALLVNFSLFFTKIVIDSGNILALIFYNKIGTEESTGAGDTKDIGGALMSGFNPNNFFTPGFINDATKETNALTVAKAIGKKNNVEVKQPHFRIRDFIIATNPFLGVIDNESNYGNIEYTGCGTLFTEYTLIKNVPVLGNLCVYTENENTVKIIEDDVKSALREVEKSQEDDNYALIAAMVAYGLIMYTLFYAFFIVAWAFLGRTMELMMLMILSPLAFVTYAVPFHISESMDFKSWTKRVVSTTFMAPVFMIILYLLSQILNSKIFGSTESDSKGIIERLITIFTPAIIIIYFLLKGVKHAKEASGIFGEGVFKYGSMALGLAGGAAFGITGFLGRHLAGRAAAAYARGPSNIAPAGVERGMQDRRILRGLRQMTKFFIKKPGAEETQGSVAEPRVTQTPRVSPISPTPHVGVAGATVTPEEKLKQEKEAEEKAKKDAEYEEMRKKGVTPSGIILASQYGKIPEPGERAPGALGATSPTPETAAQELKAAAQELKAAAQTLKEKEEKAATGAPGSASPKLKAATQEEKEEGKGTEHISETATPEEKEEEKGPIPKSARTLKDKVADGEFWARQKAGIAKKMAESSFDFRNTRLGKLLSKKTGIDFGEGKGKGGYNKAQKDKDEENMKLAKWLMPSQEELAQLNLLDSELSSIEESISVETDKGKKDQLEKQKKELEKARNLENARIEDIKKRRRNNFAKTVERGYGIDWVASRFGLYHPTNLATANKIRNKFEESLKEMEWEENISKLIEKKVNEKVGGKKKQEHSEQHPKTPSNKGTGGQTPHTGGKDAH